MSCAYYLANMGYKVKVYDKNPVPGGMLTLGIPNFRLEKDVVNAEIEVLKMMGVEFICGVEVGKDITIQQLRDEGVKGFYVAIPLGSFDNCQRQVPLRDVNKAKSFYNDRMPLTEEQIKKETSRRT